MSSSNEFKPQFGKAPLREVAERIKSQMRNEVAERITSQINENIQTRLRQQVSELKQKLALETNARNNEDALHKKEIEGLLGALDAALDFIAQNMGDIPPELLDLIAGRQEERLKKNSVPDQWSPVDVQGSSDGQVLRLGPNGVPTFVKL